VNQCDPSGPLGNLLPGHWAGPWFGRLSQTAGKRGMELSQKATSQSTVGSRVTSLTLGIRVGMSPAQSLDE
jgi:hypothetical protein